MKKYVLLLCICILFLVGFSANTGENSEETDSNGKGNLEVTEKEYSFESDGKKIYARALIPESKEKMPLVILSHGFGGNHEQEQIVQEEIAKGRIAVFSFDFAGGSGYSTGKSEGSNKDMSVLTEVTNLKDAFEFASKLDFVDKAKIYLFGASQGGVVSTLVAEELKDEIAGLYLLYPTFSLFDDARERFKTKDDIPETINLMGITVGRKYFTDIYDMDIYTIMKNIKVNTHIFHGTSDDLVSISYSQNAVKTFLNAELTELRGSGHGFTSNVQKQIAPTILNEILSKESSMEISMKIDGTSIDVEWENNDTVKELKEELKKGELTIQLSKYSDFEQVGELGKTYSSSDKRLTTKAGDIMLYSGNKIVVFYGENTWEYTRIGKIKNLGEDEIKRLLSNENVELKLK